jgi:hypothetical protein
MREEKAWMADWLLDNKTGAREGKAHMSYNSIGD